MIRRLFALFDMGLASDSPEEAAGQPIMTREDIEYEEGDRNIIEECSPTQTRPPLISRPAEKSDCKHDRFDEFQGRRTMRGRVDQIRDGYHSQWEGCQKIVRSGGKRHGKQIPREQ